MHPPLIIVGTHRSGTSLLTRLLIGAGIFFGHRRLKVEEEAWHFLKLNRWLLAMGGTDWDRPLPMLEALVRPEDVELLARAVEARLHGRHTLGFLGPRYFATRGDLRPGLPFAWGFKDPRSSLTLPVWLRLYPEARVLRIRRHGVPVAASLTSRFHAIRAKKAGRGNRLARWGFALPDRDRVVGAQRCATLAGALAVWDEYEQVLDRWMAAGPVRHALTLRYEALLAEPEQAFARIGTLLGTELAHPADASVSLDAARADAWRNDPELVKLATSEASTLARHGYSD